MDNQVQEDQDLEDFEQEGPLVKEDELPEPEGYEKEEGLGEDYPLDAVLVRPINMSVSDVMKRIKDTRWIIDPDFQRDFVWDKTRQSRLIESCIMRIPLPVFYLAEDKEGKVMVVDGLQRLSTFLAYTDNSFGLFGLGKGEGESKKNNPLLRKKFKDLPVNLQERIVDTQLTLYILDKAAPARAKLDIFDRVNSGMPLSRQQMRNSLYSGQATRWLKEQAESNIFLQATGKSLSKKTMRDREAINRFCGFYLRRDKYKGDMDTFLADTLEYMNSMSQQGLDELAKKFANSMSNNFSLFSNHAFRKSFASDDPYKDRAIINIALFDVYSVLMADIEPEALKNQKDVILEKSDELILADEEFVRAITTGTNDKLKVDTRFSKVSSILNEAKLTDSDLW